MIRNVGKILIGVLLLGLLLWPVSVLAATPGSDAVCAGIGAAGGTCDPSSGTQINNIIKFALSMLSFAAGVIGVVMLIIAGIKYITSQGDSGQIKSAKNTLLYAVIGIVVAVMAQLIVHFVLNKTASIVTGNSGTSDGSELVEPASGPGSGAGVDDGGVLQ